MKSAQGMEQRCLLWFVVKVLYERILRLDGLMACPLWNKW